MTLCDVPAPQTPGTAPVAGSTTSDHGRPRPATSEPSAAPAAPGGTGQPDTSGEGVEELLARVRATAAGPERRRLRASVIESQVPLARRLAGRFTQRGEPLEDLVQVAMIGLLKAVDGFEPERGLRFSSYAVPTIVGELKRHFRDKGWDVRLPRPLQELVLDIRKVRDEFGQRKGRAPTVAELAERLDVTEEHVIEALTASAHYRSLSLDAPVGGSEEEDPNTLGDTLADIADMSTEVEDHLTLRPLLNELPERERTILMMRFYGNQTQSAIAERMGISQMHVSRLLSKTLAQLRTRMLADPEEPQPQPRGARGRRGVGSGTAGTTARPSPVIGQRAPAASVRDRVLAGS